MIRPIITHVVLQWKINVVLKEAKDSVDEIMGNSEKKRGRGVGPSERQTNVVHGG